MICSNPSVGCSNPAIKPVDFICGSGRISTGVLSGAFGISAASSNVCHSEVGQDTMIALNSAYISSILADRDTQCANFGSRVIGRSEEHTSELQSLMRISYAVFCLKKKKSHE